MRSPMNLGNSELVLRGFERLVEDDSVVVQEWRCEVLMATAALRP